jgi:Ran GTPase-activating protein (RanGAP) involved in mRNA processing and transport
MDKVGAKIEKTRISRNLRKSPKCLEVVQKKIKQPIIMVRLSCFPSLRPKSITSKISLPDVAEIVKGVSSSDFRFKISSAESNSELQKLGLSKEWISRAQIMELQRSCRDDFKSRSCHDEFKTSSLLYTDKNTSLVLVARRQADPSCIVRALASNPQVECAIILDCGFTDDMASRTALALARGCSLLSALVLPQNRITSEGIRHLSAGLLIHAALHTLDLSGNACGDHGSECLAVLVCSSPALRVLNLRSNGIGPTGAAVLAAALVPFAQDECSNGAPSTRRCGVALAELDLSRNRIGDAGARSFAAALGERACALRSLDLSCNVITSRGARRLAAALPTNRALESLRVVSIALGDEEEAVLKDLEQASRALAL